MFKKLLDFFSYSDVELIESRDAFNGFYRFTVNTLKHKTFAGGWTQPIERELLLRPDAVGVLIYDPRLDSVALVEQFRIGAYMHVHTHGGTDHNQYQPWVLELVAGLIDKPESAETVAIRECKEEAGVEVTAIKPLHRYLCSPGGTSEEFRVFCACADLSALSTGDIHGLDEENEDIRLHLLSTQEFFGLLDEGHLNNSHSIIAAQWLRANKANLDLEWA